MMNFQGEEMPTSDHSSKDDEPTLASITREIRDLAKRFDALETAATEHAERRPSAFHFGTRTDFSGSLIEPTEEPTHRNLRPALPDSKLVREIIRLRRVREKHFDGDLFADPAWDMLLDLAAARAEYQRVSVTSLCIASAVPPTTALRWIGQMTEAGIFERFEDETDRRRAFLRLSDSAVAAMSRYFDSIRSSKLVPI